MVQTIRDVEPVASALERLAESGYDQLPVLDSGGRVVGVFSWKSFGRSLSEIYSLDVDSTTLNVIHSSTPSITCGTPSSTSAAASGPRDNDHLRRFGDRLLHDRELLRDHPQTSTPTTPMSQARPQ